MPKWLEGILVAAASAAIQGIAGSLVDPQHADPKHLGVVAGTSAMIGVAAWLRNPNGGGGDPPPGNVTQFPSTH